MVNFDLMDEAARMLVHAATHLDYRDFAARLRGRTRDIDPDALDIAQSDFAVVRSGSWVKEH